MSDNEKYPIVVIGAGFEEMVGAPILVLNTFSFFMRAHLLPNECKN